MARRRMLIRRDFQGYTGGHGKFRDYVGHIDAHPHWRALVYQTPDSVHDETNPFDEGVTLTPTWRPGAADALLLGGMDWAALPHELDTHIPILNLVQGVRHADPAQPLRDFLRRRAIRICVSTAVAEAIAATDESNGSVTIIQAAVDVTGLRSLGSTPVRQDVFVDAVKQPTLGRQVAECLRAAGLDVHLQLQRLPREKYLAAMARAAIVLPLPGAVEGFYLPGLEALAMGRAVVQPDCLGSREYLRDDHNALVPAPSAAALAEAVQRLHGDIDLRQRLVAAGLVTAARHGLDAERRHVHDLLDRIDVLWAA